MDSAVVDTARSLVASVNEQGGDARVLGGIAVALRCPTARSPAPLSRAYSDIDLVTSSQARAVLAQALEEHGCVPAERFNALHGHKRLMFEHPDGIHLDVFVGTFEMCHRLELTPRLGLHDLTIPLSDLLLTKLQVAELNEKDVTDAAALLLDHELGDDETGINTDYIAKVLGADWGWWRTVSHNLRAVASHLDGRLPASAAAEVARRAERLLAVVDDAPKSLRWRLRAKAGDRIPWREEPEESH